MASPDPALEDDLERFTAAQDPVFDRVLAELRAGAKQSHWMWFIFPQRRGLGQSDTSRFYGIRDAEEARAYLAHPLLGPRLVQCIDILMSHDRSARQLLGTPDDLKLCSCLSLFASVAPEGQNLFAAAHRRFCRGRAGSGA